MKEPGNLTQKDREQEVIPDAIEGLREAKLTAGAIDSQIWRLENAGGKIRGKKDCESTEKISPPMYVMLANSIKELNVMLNQIHVTLTHEIDILLGESK